MPTRSKLPMVLSYFALNIFLSFNSRYAYASSPELTIRCSILLGSVLIEFFPSYPFVSTVKILKEGRQLHRDALMHRNEDINAMDRPLREEQLRPRNLLEFRNQIPSPLLPLLNHGTRFLVVEEICDARVIKLQ